MRAPSALVLVVLLVGGATVALFACGAASPTTHDGTTVTVEKPANSAPAASK